MGFLVWLGIKMQINDNKNRDKLMNNLYLIHNVNRVVRATMLLSAGIWIGMNVATYPDYVSTPVFLIAFSLIGICAFVIWRLNHKIQKLQQSQEKQETPENSKGQREK